MEKIPVYKFFITSIEASQLLQGIVSADLMEELRKFQVKVSNQLLKPTHYREVKEITLSALGEPDTRFDIPVRKTTKIRESDAAEAIKSGTITEEQEREFNKQMADWITGVSKYNPITGKMEG